MKTLSIIVPVYNVEQFIRPCVESIYKQGLDEETFEVILVNDGTRDNSIGVVYDLIASHRNITVVEQTNQGLSAARNTGLRESTGRYVLFLDSDDLLEPDTVVALLRTAQQNDADMVVADFLKMTCVEINEGFPPPSDNVTDTVKSGPELFVEDFNPRECYVWRTLYRREFLDREQLRFIPGIYFEDVPFTVECLLKAGTCVRSSRTFIYIGSAKAPSWPR